MNKKGRDQMGRKRAKKGRQRSKKKRGTGGRKGPVPWSRGHEDGGAPPELLAPAGSLSALHAALEAGADAVYVGAGSLNARAYGSRFGLADIAEMAALCHERGRKLFVALNSLVKERELAAALELLAGCDLAQVDGVIIQDLGILRLARRHFPQLRLHASTLMAIHNSAGVESAARLGFKRVVLARELTLAEIGRIVRSSSIEIEVFIHGALCFSISGLCLFSSFHGGRSSMRGRCVQPCRRLYRWGGRQGAFFSMSDLAGLEAVPELKAMGVASLKIEGRLKPPEYVHAVTAAYRMVLDCRDRKQEAEAIEEAKRLLASSGGRHVTSGYFHHKRPAAAISPGQVAATGVYLGRLEQLDLAGKRALLEPRGKVLPEEGDEARIVWPGAEGQLPCTIVGIRSTDEGRMELELSIKALSPAPDQGASSRQAGQHGAFERPLLFRTKRAATPFAPKPIEMKRETDFVQIVRKARKEAKEILSGMSKGKVERRPPAEKGQSYEIVLKVDDLDLALRYSGQREGNISAFSVRLTRKNLKDALKRLPKGLKADRIIWAIEPVIYEEALAWTKRAISELISRGFHQFEVSNLGHFSLFPSAHRKGARGGRHRTKTPHLYSGYQLNLLNSQALSAARSLGVKVPCISVESDLENIKRATSNYPGRPAIYAFGFLPMFTSRLHHRIFNQKERVRSTKGEEFWWRFDGHLGRLYPARPYSALGVAQELLALGLNRWIIDLSTLPDGYRLPRRFPAGLSRLASHLKGSRFNLKTRLE